MKKFFKALALVLALALVIGVVPAQATSAKIKAKKTLYVDGAKGASTDGTKTSSYKERVAIYKLAGAKKADKEDHKFTAKIKSGDSVTVSKNYVYAAGLGKSVVELFKDGESLGTTVVTVKKNATADTLTITEFEDGKEVVCGVEYTVTLPRKGVDSDERRLFVDDKAVEDKEDAPRAYAVKFTKAGDHKVKFEAFQSAELDKATASKEITVKAVMPQPVSAKQVSASSFAVEFEGNMEGLISKDDITNQMIYYLIAKEPVVTGVIKSVEVKDKVVTITMYSNFNNDTDYYFAYGAADAVKFHTAKNDIKYATSIKIIPAKAYYVGEETDVTYKFYNADGVELDITDTTAALSFDSDVAYLVGSKLYFYKEGDCKLSVSIVTGYDETTNEPNKLTDSITVTGVTKTTTQTGKIYSFGGTYDKQYHSIRITANGAADAVALKVQYTLSDDSHSLLESDTQAFKDAGYYLKSTDETVAMITDLDGGGIGLTKNAVYGVNTGNATIVLCDKDNVALDAFNITVDAKNKVSGADISLSKETFNTAIADDITLTINPTDLNGSTGNDVTESYSYTVKQADNNADAVKVEFHTNTAYSVAKGGHGKVEESIRVLGVVDKREAAAQTGFATVRIVVTVKDENDTAVATKNLSFVVSLQDTANAWRINATESSLDTSEKNWKDKNLATAAYQSKVTVNAVKSTGYGDFLVQADLPFTIKSSINDVPVTGPATNPATEENFLIVKYPDNANTVSENANNITVSAFSTIYEHAKTGTYSFTGIHVAYGSDEKGVRTTMGTVNVVVSRSDVKATATVVDGTAANFKKYIVDAGTRDFHKIFKISWDSLTSDDKNGGLYTNRVYIANEATDVKYTYDTTTQSYYVSKIVVTVVLDNAKSGNYSYTQDVVINKLFKDK